jgi:hypothetical protein
MVKIRVLPSLVLLTTVAVALSSTVPVPRRSWASLIAGSVMLIGSYLAAALFLAILWRVARAPQERSRVSILCLLAAGLTAMPAVFVSVSLLVQG